MIQIPQILKIPNNHHKTTFSQKQQQQFKQMLQSQQLKQQSLSLLKEQTTKLKIQSRDIELKDEQIRFLKQTILTLQQQKDAIAHHNHQLKTKLKTMAAQISQYNLNVVQKIYQQNQEYVENCQTLKNDLENVHSQRSDLHKKYMQIESQLQQELRHKQEMMEINETLKQLKSKNEKKINLIEKQNKQLQQKNISLQRQVDQSSHQINYCSQQIDILTQKHQQALKHNEKKIKQTVDKMVVKQQHQKIQKQLKDSLTRNSKHLKQLQRKQKQKQKLKLQLLTCKQKIMTYQINQQTKSLQLKTDIINLSQSIKLSKKISQFQSQQHQNVSSIYDCYCDMLQKYQKMARKLQISQDKHHSLQSQLKVMEDTLRLVQVQLNTVRERRLQEKQSLQAQYQSKLMEISIRLRKQEMSLAIIKNKQSSLDQLQQQFDQAQQQHKLQRQTLHRTIEQQSKQNKKLSQQLSSAVRLCEQNMLDRQCIMNYKYVLQDIIAVVHYLHSHLIKRKQKICKIYRPFIYKYFENKSVLNKDTKIKKKAVNRFKVCAWMIVSIIRMKKQSSSGKGLLRYAKNAIQRRYNIKNLSSHVQKISNCIIQGGKVEQVLKQSQQVYKWKLPAYKKVSFGESSSLYHKQGYEVEKQKSYFEDDSMLMRSN